MRALLTLLFIAVPTAAFAHPGHGLATFGAGLLHPLTGLDHLAAMLAVGVLAALIGGRALVLVPLSFIAMMLAGFVAGLAGLSLPVVELGIGLSALVIGGATAWGRSVPTSLAMGLAGFFALFHGLAHGAEMPADAPVFSYALGFLAATALLHGIGLAATALALRVAGPRTARLAGAGFAVLGTAILAGFL